MIELPPLTFHHSADGPWWKMRATWVYDALLQGRMGSNDASGDEARLVTLESVGTLSLPGGEFVAADPYVMDLDPHPFDQRLGAEQAEVIAGRLIVGEGHERVAALVLRASASPVCDWAMATVDGQDIAHLDADGFYGFGVDAGTGSFGNPGSMRVAARVLHDDGGMLEDPVSEALFADGIGTRSAVLVEPEPGAEPVAACSTGWGDGVYPTWLGLDAAGVVVVAVTDFLLEVDPHAAPAEPVDEAAPSRSKSLLKRLLRR